MEDGFNEGLGNFAGHVGEIMVAEQVSHRINKFSQKPPGNKSYKIIVWLKRLSTQLIIGLFMTSAGVLIKENFFFEEEKSSVKEPIEINTSYSDPLMDSESIDPRVSRNVTYIPLFSLNISKSHVTGIYLDSICKHKLHSSWQNGQLYLTDKTPVDYIFIGLTDGSSRKHLLFN